MFMPDGIREYDEEDVFKKLYIGKDFKPLYDALSNVRAKCL